MWPSDVAVPWPRLLRALRERHDRDFSFWDLLRDLDLGTDQADPLREQVAFLEERGIIAHHRRARLSLHSRDRLIVGRVSIPASSREVARHWGATGAFGFVGTSDPGGDLYLPARGLAGARHGDVVLARETTSARSDRSQGEVVAVLERAPSRFAGEIVEVEGNVRVRPRDDRAGADLPLARSAARAAQIGGRLESEEGYRRRREEEAGAGAPIDRESTSGAGAAPAREPRPGDLVIAEVSGEASPRAWIVEVIGPAADPASAERMVTIEYSLPGEFPPEAEAEAGTASLPVGEADLEGREDFRSETVVTIDPADARDFDDAVSAERLEGGDLRLWVHIADVAHYVRSGGALDREALARGTSVYFPGRVIPMLPHALSSGICSLREGEDRLVQSVGITYTRDAKVAGVRFADGVIRSAARLTYEEAAAAMQDPAALAGRGEAGGKAAALLALLAPLARRLTEARRGRGALDLDLPEIEFDPGKDGLPAALRTRERTDAHRLIEEFMLAANEAVARFTSDQGGPSIYRVHEPPDRREVEEVEEQLADLGVRRGGRSLAARLQGILSRFRGRPEEAIVARQVLRAMKLARYADAPGDHFGLALKRYTHFTSPIRRYPDLVVHRVLRSARAAARGGALPARSGAPPAAGAEEGRIPKGRLADIAAESSRLERRAEQAERAVNDLLVAHHMSGRVGETFEGRVSGVIRSGVFVAFEGRGLPAGIAEGFAPTPRAERFLLTEPVRVRLEEVDLLRGHLRLDLVPS